MKILVLVFCIAMYVWSGHSKILPSTIPQFCAKSVPDYNECMLETIPKILPYLLKGIKEANFPKLHPLTIPTFSVNRKLYSMIAIKGEMKNIQVYGYDQMKITNFDFNPNQIKGNLGVHIPYLNFKFEFDVGGSFGDFSMENAGFVLGNVSDLDLNFNLKLKRVNKVGVEYFSIDKIKGNGRIGGGHINIIAKDPAQQANSDFIVSAFNNNAKEIFEVVNPIYDESVTVFYGDLIEKFIASVPAEELLPK